jgi:hypothetical protein
MNDQAQVARNAGVRAAADRAASQSCNDMRLDEGNRPVARTLSQNVWAKPGVTIDALFDED